MSNVIDDFEDFWYNVDSRWEQKEDFLSCVDDLACPCPVCDISEEEKKKAEAQMDKWLSKFG